MCRIGALQQAGVTENVHSARGAEAFRGGAILRGEQTHAGDLCGFAGMLGINGAQIRVSQPRLAVLAPVSLFIAARRRPDAALQSGCAGRHCLRG